jgi:hypothetical protein
LKERRKKVMEGKSVTEIFGLNQLPILVGAIRDFGIEVRVSENYLRIWIIKNYVGFPAIIMG